MDEMKSGTDVRISPHAIIRYPDLATLGDHVAIDPFVTITTALEIGNYVHIGPQSSVVGGRECMFVMKDFSSIAAGSRIICGSEKYGGEGLINPTIPAEYRVVDQSTVTMEKYTTLATNVIVYPGVTIGEGTVVGAASIVTSDLQPWGIYVGSPPRRIQDRPRDKILRYAECLARRID